MSAPPAPSSAREKAPKPSSAATPKLALRRRSPASESNSRSGKGVRRSSNSRQSGRSASTSRRPSGSSSSPGATRASSAGKVPSATAPGQELAGRDVDPGQRQALLAARQRGEEVVAARLEQAVLGQRAGGDEADDLAPHQRLGAAPPRRRRVLGLLADRDLEALPDQALEVALGAVDRHAAHRDVVALVAAALGQRDVERRRRELRVLEEQLVEVAHAEEQEAARMLGLERLILGDHRRGGGRWLAGGHATR